MEQEPDSVIRDIDDNNSRMPGQDSSSGRRSTKFETLLARDGYLVYKTRGQSMEPMLRQNRDVVIIRVPVSRLKKYDVALYKRGNVFVLHRVIGVREGEYLIRGDNTYAIEHVPDEAVIGVLTGFKRKGKQIDMESISYVLYTRVWNWMYPLRHAIFFSRRLAVSFMRKMGILPVIKKLLGR